MTSGGVAALVYEEPAIVTILIQSSFLLLLNASAVKEGVVSAQACTPRSADEIGFPNGETDPAAGPAAIQRAASAPHARAPEAGLRNTSPGAKKPVSLYPAAVLGLAMVPRGEIGFLISAVAESRGVLGSSGEPGGSEIFLIATWAIVLCTVLGPVSVGLLVRRLKRLEAEAAASGRQGEKASSRDVLGVWGV